MNFKKIFIMLCVVVCANVNAENIDNSAAVGIMGAANTATTACVKVAFIKRSSGTIVTGLSTAKFKPFQSIETATTTTGNLVRRNFNFTYSLAPTTQSGVYNLCVTPTGVGMVWKRTGILSASYSINGIILGLTAADNGLISVSFM